MQNFTPRSVRSRIHLINFIIDTICIAILTISVCAYSFQDSSGMWVSGRFINYDTLYVTVFYLTFFCYYFFLEAGFGWTFGKLVTGTRLETIGGESTPPPPATIFIRTLIRMIPVLNLFDGYSYCHPINEGLRDTWLRTKLVGMREKTTIDTSIKVSSFKKPLIKFKTLVLILLPVLLAHIILVSNKVYTYNGQRFSAENYKMFLDGISNEKSYRVGINTATSYFGSLPNWTPNIIYLCYLTILILFMIGVNKFGIHYLIPGKILIVPRKKPGETMAEFATRYSEWIKKNKV